MKTFVQLQREVLRYFDVEDEPDGSADKELVKSALNEANQQRATEDKWTFMRSPVHTLAVVAGTQTYVLPHENLRKLHYLWSTTNRYFLSETPMREVPYADISFDQSDTGTSKLYEIAEMSPTKAQPSTVAPLSVESTETETEDEVLLYIEGYDADGASISEEVAPGDNTTQDFSKVTYVAKVGDWEGTMTLDDDAGNNLLTLTASQYAKQYPVLKFMAIPTQADTCTYRFFKKPRVMTRDYDVPDLPFPTCNILVFDALLSLATYNELDSESVNIWREKQSQWMMELYNEKLTGDTIGGGVNTINEVGLMN